MFHVALVQREWVLPLADCRYSIEAIEIACIKQEDKSPKHRQTKAWFNDPSNGHKAEGYILFIPRGSAQGGDL